MRVRAIQTGFYNSLRIPDTDSAEFEVPDGTKGSWFQPVEQKDNGKGGKKPEARANEKPADDLV